ncbi:SDR family NAD(P)-dependent oxidoreductase, partial [Streptomyces sp. WAC05374]|uniref:SDR family NAD(P)-dependent oxidoreductase n=2 Tax=Streptomyces sp. WAC05374 TaxID=2487420 RepID=UPI003FCDD3B1
MSISNQDRMEAALPAIRALQKRAADLEAQRYEPIAVVSMACRLPGGIDTPEAFWELLASGGDAVGGLPSRWDSLGVYDPDPEAVGKSYAREGGFIKDVEGFDAGFFGISPREALTMDPQQRLVLEASWEALERAGIRPDSLSESKTGVYLGTMSSDYGDLGRDLDALDGYVSTGKASSVVSGRVAYTLGLQGPAITVDTACSSSLVAVHLAVQALRSGECELALAGGVTVMSAPSLFVEFSRLKGMAADGRCKSFSAQADGAGWAEGAGVVVLKRLSAAQRDGDRVLAVIRGSAVNQDGRSQGLTAPNGPSQQRVVQAALEASRLTPADIDAIEAHGTGTSLGDPIEAGALAEVFGPSRSDDRPVWLGSSKSNIGHAQAAAGVVGVIKMVLALQHETLPKTLHAEQPSELIEWDGSGLALLQEARSWERDEARPRRAGVSSFGLSGTNAHVVIEEPPAVEPVEATPVADGSPYPVVVSGRDEAALREQAGRWASWLSDRGDVRVADVAVTAARHRTHFASRASVVAAGSAELVEALTALAEGRSHDAVVTGSAERRGKVVFVYPGQGSQWVGMGRELLASSEVFAQTIDACDAALRPFTGWSVREVLAGEEGDHPPFDRVDVVQPALFAMGVGLSAVWRSLGVEPAAVVGHSQGEVVAAVVSGALTLEQGAQIVAQRSQAVLACAGQGGMALIERPVAVVEEFLAPYGDALSVAAVNTAGSTIISGEAEAITRIVDELQAKDVYARKINVDYASHNAQMDPLLPGLAENFTALSPRRTDIAFYSTVTGQVAEGPELDGGYWCRNLREPVRFDRALNRLLEDGHTVFVEISAHPVLSMPLTDGSAEHGGIVVGSLARDHGTPAQLLRNLGLLHVQGHTLDWNQVLGEHTGTLLTDLPTYAFQRERFWIDAAKATGDVRSVGLRASEHPWLGAVTATADDDGYLFTGRLALADQPWLAEHAVSGTVLVPGTGLLDIALAAAHHTGADRVEELTLLEPLILTEDTPVRLQVVVGAETSEGRRPLSLFSRADDAPEESSWRRHATGELARARSDSPGTFAEMAQWPVAGAERVELDGFYDAFRARGLEYGPAFQGLTELWRKGSTAYGLIRLPGGLTADDFGIHPALLDAALHPMAAVQGDPDAPVVLPFEWTGVELYASGATELRVRIDLDDTRDTLRLWATDPAGQPVVHALGLRLRTADPEQLRAAAATAEHLYRLRFQPARVPAEAPEGDVWVLGGDGRVARALGAESFAGADALFARLDEGAEAPRHLVVDATDRATGDVRGTTAGVLTLVQRVLADPRLEQAELTWVTCRAVDTGDGVLDDLAHAPLWGLLRAVRAEHAERVIRLVDVDEAVAVPFAADEPEIAVRGGEVLVARLEGAGGTDGAAPAFAPGGRVLITGGTGELGRALAGHLVREYGVKHLVLTSRRGADTPGARDLVAELTAAGAESVDVRACDVADRDQVHALLTGTTDTNPDNTSTTDDTTDRPWTGIFHLAAVLDDGLLASQTPERLAAVWAPKADGARHLHDLSQELGLDLAAFVLFSSAAGILGGAGQSTYAAANASLDALAAHRRSQGLPATSLGWGLWQQAGTGLTATLGRAELARLRRQGVGALTPGQALAALDAALAHPCAHLVPARLELAALHGQDGVPPLLRGLVRGPRRRAGDTSATPSGLRDRLAALPVAERLPHLTRLVQREAAAVLGMPASGTGGKEQVGKDQVFKDIGFDSLMAVELRRRLSAETGLALPSTLVFDHPTPVAVAGLLLGRLAPAEATGARVAPGPARGAAASDDPIAVVSMACRLPGGVTTPDEYWRLLSEGIDAIGPLPSRWDGMDLYDPDPDAVGKSYGREGGFIDDVERFDAAFFGISPREAASMDPQQRLVLETAWEALERAGIRPGALRGSATAVYIGTMGSDYGDRNGGALEALNGYVGTGNAASVISGRVSYALGLQGPAVTVDTACSSSLVALHLAAASLRQGECDLALVGGVTVMSTPSTFVEFSRLKAMAPDGRCRSFSADGAGAGWSEGVGMLVLKRLSAAERDGDRVLAVIRGSAVNQDGASNGLTAPNGPSQQRVVRDALAASRLAPTDIDAIEAHGTGTNLGDPIEAGALAEVFGQHRLFLGSAKSNLGHTQAAAGVVGVMKMVLALQHETLPRTLHAEVPSPHIDWAASGLTLLREARPWPYEEGRARRAGVSAFGISGTNAHVVLEEAPRYDGGGRAEPDGSVDGWPLLLSGQSEGALRAQAGRWADWLAGHPDVPLSHVVRTAALHRTHLPVRASLDVASVSGAVRALSALAAGLPHEGVVVGDGTQREGVVVGDGAEREGAVFVCAEHAEGTGWVGAGRELLVRSAVFAETVGACDAALRPLTGWSVRDVLAGDAEGGADAAGPALFTLGLGLAALWTSVGVDPVAVVGRGVGETVAAVVGGSMSLEEGARIAAGGAAGDSAATGRDDAYGEELERLARDGHDLVVDLFAHADLTVAGVLRRLGELHARGCAVDWSRVPGAEVAAEVAAPPVELPTYAFQRERYWTEPEPGRAGTGVRAAGLGSSAHPWVGATTPLAGGEGHLLTGRLSAAEQPWLVDHAAFGVAIVPGTGMLELALTAAAEVGAGGVTQLTLLEPLPLAAGSATRVQVAVSAAEADGRRTVTIHSLPEGADGAWTRHAVGVLGAAGAAPGGAADFPDLARWPVAGAERVDLDGFYGRFEERGLDYGPAFRGLVELWRDGGTAYGRVCLPEGLRGDAYGVHPALLDAALHACMGARDEAEGQAPVLFPFEWSDVELWAVGSGELRVRVDVDDSGTGLRLWAAGADGSPVLSGRLRLREVTAGQVRAAARPDHLHRVELREVDVPRASGTPSGVSRLVVDARDWSGTVTEVATRGLAELQRLLAGHADDELVWLTSGAAGDDARDPAQASLWGLVRTARGEFPERTVRLIDTAGADVPVADALAVTGEPELVVRDGRVYAPRLAAVARAGGDAPVLDPGGAVLVTGGTGELGRAVAAHLVRAYGVRHLVLTSRSGPRAAGADELVAELTAAGARTVDVVACDAADRAEVAAVLADATAERPLTGVFHLAAVVDDGLLASQSPERLARVMAAKTESALHLHELTRDLDPAVFVLFSSAAGVLGTAGQSTYAAANTALDALAAYRRGLGLPGTSLSWGLWEQAGLSRTASLGRADLARMRRQGFGALTRDEGLAALDAALRTSDAHLVPVKLDLPALHRRAAGPELPVLLRDRLRPGARVAPGAAAAGRGVEERLASLTGDELREALVELVRREATDVLGLAATMPAGQRFQELGLDSLTAVELRRRVTRATGTTLPSTVAFDHPTPVALAERLLDALSGTGERTAAPTAPTAPAALAAPAAPATAPVVSRTAVRPATEGQKRLWFLDRLHPGSAQYNATMTLRLSGALDRAAFEAALAWLMERHEALRTGLESRDGRLVQVVHEDVAVPVTYRDAAGLPADEVRELLSAERRKPFALSGRTLLRCLVVDAGDGDGDGGPSVCLTMHHAITDGWSIALLLHELTDAYRAFLSGARPEQPAVAGTLGDFAAREEEAARSGRFDEGVRFFREQLAGVPRLEFPPGPGTAAEGAEGGTVHFTVPAGVRSGVEALAAARSVTPYTVLVSAFAVLMARVTGQDDFGIGTVWANRQVPEAEGLVGFLANTLPLRCDVTGDPAFGELVDAMAARVRGTMEHQAVPLTEVVRAVGGPRTGDENPLFRCLFNYASMPMAAQGNEFWRLAADGSLAGNVDGAAKSDLGLTLLPFGDGLRGELEYRPEAWAPGAARRLVDAFLTLLPSLLAEPGRPVGRADLLPPGELAWLEERGGRLQAAGPEGPTALERVLAQARRTPDAVALVCGEQELTYGRMVARATALAGTLEAAGVTRESLVGIHLPRSADLVVAVLATWLAGGAYVPLDPEYPAARLEHVIRDSGLTVLVSDRPVDATAGVVLIDDLPDVPDGTPLPEARPSLSDLAYVIYTSGSTGLPKGVQLEHAQFANFCTAMDERVGGGAGDTWLAVTSLSFDISTLELLWTLTRGYRVVVAQGGPASWAGYLPYAPTHLQCTPSLARMLLADADGRSLIQGLDRMLVGGEALDRGLARTLRELCGGGVMNMYGPTETTVWSAAWNVTEGEVSLGEPLVNNRLYVLDGAGRRVPRGSLGELWIGGLGVARGYLNRPELTAERFV